MKQVCFCADDYALNVPVSHAILELVDAQRLHAVSCMTQSSEWAMLGQQLQPYRQQTEIGLHFNLTHYFPSMPHSQHYPLNQLMLKAWLRQLDKKSIYADLQQQWDRFTDVMGFSPHFIDGHQHIHQFPVIRTVLLDFLKRNEFGGWVRNLSNTIKTPEHGFKSVLLPRLGGFALDYLCQQFQVETNRQFAGIYDFSMQPVYQQLVSNWLDKAAPGALVMCHPALLQTDNQDVIAAARFQEYLYLRSNAFVQDCARHQVSLARIGAI